MRRPHNFTALSTRISSRSRRLWRPLEPPPTLTLRPDANFLTLPWQRLADVLWSYGATAPLAVFSSCALRLLDFAEALPDLATLSGLPLGLSERGLERQNLASKGRHFLADRQLGLRWKMRPTKLALQSLRVTPSLAVGLA
jgi:hypothetical protein